MNINPFAHDRLAIYSENRLSGRYLDIKNRYNNDCRAVAVLDPLQVDDLMRILPEIIVSQNVPTLISTLKKILPLPDILLNFNFFHAAACMRDIGIFLGALKRYGVEPLEVVPELDFILYTLANITNMPPRDTLLHYTVWNPDNGRIRTYTGLPDEMALIKSVQMSMSSLSNAIYALKDLYYTPLEEPKYALLSEMVYLDLKNVIGGIVHAKKNVSPKVFSIKLRHYYDSIKLNGNDLIGPGAVEMPFFVLDHILWSSDCMDNEYINFKKTYLPFITPDLRNVYTTFEDKPSLITLLCSELEDPQSMSKCKIDAAKRILYICKQLKSFRMPHRKLAEESYQHEDKHSNKGSGGYSTDILTHIIDLNIAKIKSLEDCIRLRRV